jgi:hypothetical protein
MWFFTSGAFWFVEGVLFVLAMIGLKVWMQDRRTPMPIWKWLLVGAWMLMCGFTIAFIGTSVGENELVAAKKGGIIFSVACVIVGVVVWGLLQVGRAGTNLEPWDIPGDEEA